MDKKDKLKNVIKENIVNTKTTINSFSYLPKAIKYIFNNTWTLKYFFINLISHLLLFFLLFFLFSSYLSSNLVKISLINENVNTGFITSLIYFISTGIGIVFSIVLVYFLSSVINSTVYSRMAGIIATKNLGIVYTASFKEEFKDSLSFELKKFSVILAFSILSFLINLIPVLGQFIYFILNTLLIILLSGLDNFQPILSTKKMRFRDKLKLILSRPYKLWGFLFFIGIITSIPFINIITIPISIISSTLIFQDLNIKNEE